MFIVVCSASNNQHTFMISQLIQLPQSAPSSQHERVVSDQHSCSMLAFIFYQSPSYSHSASLSPPVSQGLRTWTTPADDRLTEVIPSVQFYCSEGRSFSCCHGPFMVYGMQQFSDFLRYSVFSFLLTCKLQSHTSSCVSHIIGRHRTCILLMYCALITCYYHGHYLSDVSIDAVTIYV